MLGSTPGWPAVLADGPVTLRPYRRGDARAWSEVRIANQKWLGPWESAPPGPWAEMNSPRAYLYVYRDMKRAARRGDSMPFAVCLREFRPAHVAERRGGGYTVQALAGGPYTLSALAEANGLLVLGERVTAAAAGSTVDVLLLDRRR